METKKSFKNIFNKLVRKLKGKSTKDSNVIGKKTNDNAREEHEETLFIGVISNQDEKPREEDQKIRDEIKKYVSNLSELSEAQSCHNRDTNRSIGKKTKDNTKVKRENKQNGHVSALVTNEVQKLSDENKYDWESTPESNVVRFFSVSSNDSGFNDNIEEKDSDDDSSLVIDGNTSAEKDRNDIKEMLNNLKIADESLSVGSNEKVTKEVLSQGDEIEEKLKNLKISDGKKSKKLKVFAVSRAPDRNRRQTPSAHPYENNTIYKETNLHFQSAYETYITESLAVLDGTHVLEQPQLCPELDQLLNDIMETVQEEETNNNRHDVPGNFNAVTNYGSNTMVQTETEFNNATMEHTLFSNEPNSSVFTGTEIYFNENTPYPNETLQGGYDGFPTPPSEENYYEPSYFGCPILSINSGIANDPMNKSIVHVSKSPKVYQETSYIVMPDENLNKNEAERINGNHELTLWDFTKLQKKLSIKLSKMDCCNPQRPTCADLFEKHFSKLAVDDRKNLLKLVTKLDVGNANRCLHWILDKLSRLAVKNANVYQLSDINDSVSQLSDIADSVSQLYDNEDWLYSLFYNICETFMAKENSQWLFVGKSGLELLKRAALRCPRRPLLTRQLARCARTVLRAQRLPGPVYQEVDTNGDNLVTACVRRGDEAVPILYELVDKENTLFDIEHTNFNELTALHIACEQHGPHLQSLHVVHVLLKHGGANLLKEGTPDTPLHLAARSPTFDLNLAMVMFEHVGSEKRFQLARLKNTSEESVYSYVMKSLLKKNNLYGEKDYLKKFFVFLTKSKKKAKDEPPTTKTKQTQ